MTEENNRTVANDNKHYQNIISQLSKYNHNINHQLRQMFDELYEELFYGDEEDNSAISTEPGDKSEDQVNPMHIWRVENIRHKFRGFLQHFTTHVKAAFETLTNDNCAVYITLVSIGEDGSEYIAETYYRDPVSYTERTHLDARKDPYNVKLFTPFKFLFSGQESTLFACDDCLSYQNFSDVCDNWHDYYNACLTVPIRVRKSKENNTHKLIGFITVDNKKGGLNNKDAKNLLCSYADLIYALLGMFIDLGGTL